jgi:hypothetical protein
MSLELIITLIACVYITIACIFYIITMLCKDILKALNKEAI